MTIDKDFKRTGLAGPAKAPGSSKPKVRVAIDTIGVKAPVLPVDENDRRIEKRLSELRRQIKRNFEEPTLSQPARAPQGEGTDIDPGRYVLAVNRLRLLVVAATGISLGYLLSPISPVAGAQTQGLIVLCILPLIGLGIALTRTARS